MNDSHQRIPGNRAVRLGVVLLVLSVAMATVGYALTVGRIDESALSRDVVFDGAKRSDVPGELRFEVAMPLSDGADPVMQVAVLISPEDRGAPRCTLRHTEGDGVTLTVPSSNRAYVHPGEPSLRVVAIAGLDPGRYVMRCADPDGPLEVAGSFTVGRVVGPGDLTSGELRPLLWFGAALLAAGAIFVAGGITLAAGLVRRARAR